MTHLLDDARGQMREGHTSAQWELLAREKVARTLLETGQFTADDLTDLNIPRNYRSHVHGAATGYFAGAEPFMDFVGRQKSSRPSRKGGKNDLYVINAKGRKELPKLLRDLQLEVKTLVGGGDGDSPRVGTSAVVASSQEPTIGLDVLRDTEGSAVDGHVEAQAAPSTGRGASPLRAEPHGAGSENVQPGGGSEVLQLDIPRESESSAHATWESAA
jgi:hypothetical protein